MRKSLIFISALVATSMVAYGGLTVVTQKKSQIPSDTQLVTAVEGVEDVNNALGEIADIRSQVNDASNRLDNVYTKSQTDAAILDKYNQTMHIGGEQTMIGVKTFMDGVRFTTVTNSLTGDAVTIQIRGTDIAKWSGKTPPSDTNLITRFTLPASGGTLVTDAGVADAVDGVYSNVYTKAQSDARFQPIGNYLRLNADGTIPGSMVKLGEGSFTEGSSPSDNANGLAYVYFDADSINAPDGAWLTSMTVRTRTTNSVTDQTVCLAVSKDGDDYQLGMTDMVRVNAINTDYTFTFVNPMQLEAGTTYRVLFRLGQGVDEPNTPMGLALIGQTSGGSYVGYAGSKQPTLRPVLRATWYTTAIERTIRSIVKQVMAE